MSRSALPARFRTRSATSRRTRAARTDRATGADPIRLELQFLPGLGDIVSDEVVERLPVVGQPRKVPHRDDALQLKLGSAVDLAVVLDLRTVVAAYLLLRFDVPRPKSLTSPDRLAAIARAIASARRLASRRGESMRSFRIDAAGRDSAVFRTLAERLGEATGLTNASGTGGTGGIGGTRDVADSGDCVVRFRRSTGDAAGWEVLVRMSARPLSSRPWRLASFPGAVNATIAAAAVRLSQPRPDDRVLNAMCGSGTLLAERLLAGPARLALGIDRDPAAVRLCTETLAAAGVGRAVHVASADISTYTATPTFDVVFACPPWGDKVGRHEDVDQLHDRLLERAHAWTAPSARLVVISHRVRAMERSLAERRSQWRQVQQTRVWAKGHHPRLYVLRRR